MLLQRSTSFYLILLLSLFGILSATANAGTSYLEPAGGWQYLYDGAFNAGVVGEQCIGGVCPPGFGGDPGESGGDDTIYALDGTWYHDQGDKWDGTAPGDPLSDPTVSASPPVSLTGKQGTSPGGAGPFTEGNTNYVRVQDAGNPEVHGWIQGLSDPSLTYPDDSPNDPVNTNRRVYFGHDIQRWDGPIADELILTNTGVTISFRMRIPHSGPLDDVYTEFDMDGDGNADVIPWFEDSPNGRGTPMTNGRGTVNVSQNAPDNVDTQVGFSLVTSTDVEQFCSGSSGSLCTGSGSGGLIMNNLNGNAPSNLIDSESPGTLNMLEMEDDQLNEWNEFWITMENNGPLAGNIEVNVYMNGSTTPDTFQVTLAANNNSVYADEDNPTIDFGISDNAGFGSFDLDFISYQLGVHEPLAAPVEDADFDQDGDIDGSDFLAWQRGFGQSGGLSEGDANGDGTVDDTDLGVWESQFGTTTPLMATFSAVPEPSSILLLLSGVGGLFAVRRRT